MAEKGSLYLPIPRRRSETAPHRHGDSIIPSAAAEEEDAASRSDVSLTISNTSTSADFRRLQTAHMNSDNDETTHIPSPTQQSSNNNSATPHTKKKKRAAATFFTRLSLGKRRAVIGEGDAENSPPSSPGATATHRPKSNSTASKMLFSIANSLIHHRSSIDLNPLTESSPSTVTARRTKGPTSRVRKAESISVSPSHFLKADLNNPNKPLTTRHSSLADTHSSNIWNDPQLVDDDLTDMQRNPQKSSLQKLSETSKEAVGLLYESRSAHNGGDTSSSSSTIGASAWNGAGMASDSTSSDSSTMRSSEDTNRIGQMSNNGREPLAPIKESSSNPSDSFSCGEFILVPMEGVGGDLVKDKEKIQAALSRLASGSFPQTSNADKRLRMVLSLSHQLGLTTTQTKVACNHAGVFKLDRFEDLYQLGPVIGRGQQGEVRQCTPCHQDDLLPPLAVKISPKGLWENGSAQTIVNFLRAQHSSFPNSLQAFALYENNWNYFFLMERLTGPDLQQFLCDFSHPTISLCKNIFRQVLQALDNLHSVQLIHRDIKPENFLLRSYDPSLQQQDNPNNHQLVLVDWALCCHADDAKWLEPEGTLIYMAPEQFLAKRPPYYCTVGVDIWAAGQILAALLKGCTLCPSSFAAHNLYRLNPCQIFDEQGYFRYAHHYWQVGVVDKKTSNDADEESNFVFANDKDFEEAESKLYGGSCAFETVSMPTFKPKEFGENVSTSRSSRTLSIECPRELAPLMDMEAARQRRLPASWKNEEGRWVVYYVAGFESLLSEFVQGLSLNAGKLLLKFFTIDFSRRIASADALKSQWLTEDLDLDDPVSDAVRSAWKRNLSDAALLHRQRTSEDTRFRFPDPPSPGFSRLFNPEYLLPTPTKHKLALPPTPNNVNPSLFSTGSLLRELEATPPLESASRDEPALPPNQSSRANRRSSHQILHAFTKPLRTLLGADSSNADLPKEQEVKKPLTPRRHSFACPPPSENAAVAQLAEFLEVRKRIVDLSARLAADDPAPLDLTTSNNTDDFKSGIDVLDTGAHATAGAFVPKPEKDAPSVVRRRSLMNNMLDFPPSEYGGPNTMPIRLSAPAINSTLVSSSISVADVKLPGSLIASGVRRTPGVSVSVSAHECAGRGLPPVCALEHRKSDTPPIPYQKGVVLDGGGSNSRRLQSNCCVRPVQRYQHSASGGISVVATTAEIVSPSLRNESFGGGLSRVNGGIATARLNSFRKSIGGESSDGHFLWRPSSSSRMVDALAAGGTTTTTLSMCGVASMCGDVTSASGGRVASTGTTYVGVASTTGGRSLSQEKCLSSVGVGEASSALIDEDCQTESQLLYDCCIQTEEVSLGPKISCGMQTDDIGLFTIEGWSQT